MKEDTIYYMGLHIMNQYIFTHTDENVWRKADYRRISGYDVKEKQFISFMKISIRVHMWCRS